MKDFLEHGLKRDLGQFEKPFGRVLELGPGNTPWKGITDSLDFPSWNGEEGYIPFDSFTFHQIWAIHFLEHIENVIPLLRDCQRVLLDGGVMNIVVPYYTSNLHHSDLDHKHTFTEDTWKTLLFNEYYDKDHSDWTMKINFNMIYGVAERNLCIATQLEKVPQDGKS